MHVKEIYVIFIHLFDSEILLIIDLNKKKGKKGGAILKKKKKHNPPFKLLKLAEGRWFSLCTLVSSTNKTDNHDITEILLKVALNTITITLIKIKSSCIRC
jgi:hypothetical protein